VSALQGWTLLLLLAGVAARGFDGPRLRVDELRYLAAPALLAVLQRLVEDQVTLDDPFFAPLILAVPIVAALRDGLRAGMATALGTWLLLVVLAGAVPAGGANDLPQETFQLATCFAVVLAGVAGSLSPERRSLGALVPLGWWLFFGVRDPRLLSSPTLLAVPLLAAGWTGLALALWSPAQPPRAAIDSPT
jgi:hypothetical protein